MLYHLCIGIMGYCAYLFFHLRLIIQLHHFSWQKGKLDPVHNNLIRRWINFKAIWWWKFDKFWSNLIGRINQQDRDMIIRCTHRLLKSRAAHPFDDLFLRGTRPFPLSLAMFPWSLALFPCLAQFSLFRPLDGLDRSCGPTMSYISSFHMLSRQMDSEQWDGKDVP